MLIQRGKSPLPENFSEGDQIQDAASRPASPTHYQRAIVAPTVLLKVTYLLLLLALGYEGLLCVQVSLNISVYFSFNTCEIRVFHHFYMQKKKCYMINSDKCLPVPKIVEFTCSVIVCLFSSTLNCSCVCVCVCVCVVCLCIGMYKHVFVCLYVEV